MTISVSIIEDDAELRESIVRYIGGAPGFGCVSAYATAEEGLERLPHDRPAVVLMDINLPQMSGIACVRRLKELAPSILVVMLTVYEDSEQIFQALAAGACGYLVKRVEPARLLEAIQEVHRGGSPMSSHIARKVVQSFQGTGPRLQAEEKLSHREQEVLSLLVKGYAYKQIAEQMSISMDTVRTYIRRIYEKLQVHSRTEVMTRLLRK
jgi:DNA-binding NarL/FixJ family response regulator